MRTREYRTLDKSMWPRGAWDHEPDKAQWPDEVTGLPCLAVRQPTFGHWCGYVGVPPEHPMHGMSSRAAARKLCAHGPITFANACTDGDESHGVCHRPEPGEPTDVWWFGFDCAHAFDLAPAYGVFVRQLGCRSALASPALEYRTLAYVRIVCAGVARQLAARITTQ